MRWTLYPSPADTTRCAVRLLAAVLLLTAGAAAAEPASADGTLRRLIRATAPNHAHAAERPPAHAPASDLADADEAELPVAFPVRKQTATPPRAAAPARPAPTPAIESVTYTAPAETARTVPAVQSNRALGRLLDLARPNSPHDQWNSDYRTRSAADTEAAPVALRGPGLNGRSLPLGEEDTWRRETLPDDYMPTDLRRLPDEYSLFGNPLYLRAEAAESLIRMFEDAERDGLTLRIFSAYRDIRHQRRLYNEAVARRGAKQRTVARPGKSEHQLGTTADVTNTQAYMMRRSFADTAEGRWLSRNAARYGWKMTVLSGSGPRSHVDEPWHIRYFGAQLPGYQTPRSRTTRDLTAIPGQTARTAGAAAVATGSGLKRLVTAVVPGRN